MADQADAAAAPAAPFAVVPDHVRDTGQYVQQTAQALANGVRQADTEIRGLMSTWRGRAASAYLTGWDEARQAAVDVLEALEVMAGLLGVTAVNFEDLEQESTTALTGGGLLDFSTSPAPAAAPPTPPTLNM